jgi:uncharacterized protein DUF2585
MIPTTNSMDQRRHTPTSIYVATAAGIIALAALILLAMGRTPWYREGSIKLWYGNAWGPENSQQFADPYTFTHILHGVLFYALLRLVAPRLPVATRFVVVIALESAWEILENTEMVIDHYRAATMALGYYGDSVLNSIGDILACALGLGLAARLPTRRTVIGVAVVELVLLLWIRDSLLLNIVMLVYPVEAVKTWQLGH